MKKLYSKPKVFIESFEISEFIAGTCSMDVGFGDTGSTKLCSYLDTDTGYTIFNSLSICQTYWDDPEDPDDDKGCYHIPVDGAGYFGS